MGAVARIVEHPLIYRLWQAPFAARKFGPVHESNDLGRVARVLDVGCGPGTSTSYFANSEYLGLDVNERYVESARRRHGREFMVADVTRDQLPDDEPFDFILVNSFLHHLPTPEVHRLLSRLSTLLAEGGHVHILELVRPGDRSLAEVLARWDRGRHPRSVEEWSGLLARHFEPVLVVPYRLRALGVTLWNMVYLKGRKRRVAASGRSGAGRR